MWIPYSAHLIVQDATSILRLCDIRLERRSLDQLDVNSFFFLAEHWKPEQSILVDWAATLWHLKMSSDFLSKSALDSTICQEHLHSFNTIAFFNHSFICLHNNTGNFSSDVSAHKKCYLRLLSIQCSSNSVTNYVIDRNPKVVKIHLKRVKLKIIIMIVKPISSKLDGITSPTSLCTSM